MLPLSVKELIENRYGQKVRYPRDCEGLSADILAKANDRISSSTLKRLFGFVKAQNYPNQHTLDVIAIYLGYPEWKDVPGSQFAETNNEKSTASEQNTPTAPASRKKLLYSVIGILALATLGYFIVQTIRSNETTVSKRSQYDSLPDLPEVRAGGRAVFHNHHIYFLGGSDAEFMRDNNWRYDTITNKWEVMPPIPTPRAEIGCAIHDQIIYCFGGWQGNDSGAAFAAEAYNIKFNSWEILPPLPIALTSVYAVALDSNIYILGGTIGETQNYFFRYFLARSKHI